MTELRSTSALKRIAFIGGAIIIASAALQCLVFFNSWQDPIKFFNNRRSQSAEFQLESTWHENGLILRSLRIEGRRDRHGHGPTVEFDAYYCIPEERNRPLPAFVLIGGLETGREAIQVIARRPAVAELGAFFTLDYPYEGPIYFEGLEILPHIPRIRQALFDGVEAIRLAVDYLETQEGIDQQRIVLLGVSLGAFYVVAAGGVDDRPAAVMSFLGGGDLRTLLEWNLRRTDFFSSRLMSSPAAVLAAWLIRPMEPLRLVGRISPRPYIQVSARGDYMIPEANALALYNAAEEPHSLIWIPATHLMPGMEDIIDKMVAVAGTELGKWGLL